jgi:5-methyltetrahydropteroyltriglutamate--homocysteine methyltransferase
MRRSSSGNILTTHAGSLPRPGGEWIDRLYQPRDLVWDVAHGAWRPIPDTDRAAFYALARDAVADVVQRQIAAGVTVISDGQVTIPGFNVYVPLRYDGFALGGTDIWWPKDLLDHPGLGDRFLSPEQRKAVPTPTCVAPIKLRDAEAVHRDIDLFNQALKEATGYQEAFMCSVSPGAVATAMPNSYYGSPIEYLFALADALAYEWRAIIDAGHVLQLDCPDLAMDRQVHFADAPLESFRAHVRENIAAIQRGLAGIPPEQIREQIRIHVCHGNYAGSHHRDVELAEILDLLMTIPMGALSVVAANSQHRVTTYRAIEQWVNTYGWPKEMILIPGVIDTLTPVEEHPDTVAKTIADYANLIGLENVIAGTDCGFQTIVRVGEVIPETAVWTRLAVQAEGAKRAPRLVGVS